MHIRLTCLTLLAAVCALPAQILHIYAIDVEGGKSTLYVSPSGESMLVDAGYAGHDYPDRARPSLDRHCSKAGQERSS